MSITNANTKNYNELIKDGFKFIIILTYFIRKAGIMN